MTGLRLLTVLSFLLAVGAARVPAVDAVGRLLLSAVDEQDEKYSCSETELCEIGCCRIGDDGVGVCGLGPTFCGKGNCTSTCDYKSECDPGWGMEWSNASACPLNVCCSDYGFCGTTSDFCGGEAVISPSCSGNSSDARTVGYYEGWNLDHKCGTMEPEDIPLGYYTHINFAFALVDPKTFKIAPMDERTGQMYQRVTALKARQPGLEVWVALGGWSMNDADQATRTTFSDLAASASAQQTFFNDLINFMEQNGFDGVDIDWEYPVADDRSGREEDYENFVGFLKNLREALDNSGHATQFGLSITIPSSYWYMRNFDIVKIDPIIDWFNIMTYDIHGVWDSTVEALGSFAMAHTNLTEIDLALDLLWRNHIEPAKVNLGLGFYGRSFTMEDPTCMSPGCPFSGGADPGPCTNTSGVLSTYEIKDIIASGAEVALDEAAAVKIVTWDTDQWVSYDDTETLAMKVKYANSLCLGGTMVWAIDLDNGTTINELLQSLDRQKQEVFTEEDLSMSGVPDLVFPVELNSTDDEL